MGFFFTIVLKLFYPTSICLLCLGVAAAFHKRTRLCRAAVGLAVATLLISGNGWVVGKLCEHLEWRYLPPTPLPSADCIVILSGCTLAQRPPRPTVEVDEAGDRLLYGTCLYRQGKAPRIVCTGGLSVRGFTLRPASTDMADLLEMLGVSKDAVITETNALNTHDHALNLQPYFKENGCKRILLVTSALHMPRAMGCFRRVCPDLDVIPAPTDFSRVQGIPKPWYHRITGFIPLPGTMDQFAKVVHEYIGLAYYRLRGWV